jgi:hypothetical protein
LISSPMSLFPLAFPFPFPLFFFLSFPSCGSFSRFPSIVPFPVLSSFSVPGALLCLPTGFHSTCDVCASAFYSLHKGQTLNPIP